jgi:hypothetical protein
VEQRVTELHAFRALQEHEVAESRFAERQQHERDGTRVAALAEAGDLGGSGGAPRRC